MEKDLGCLCCLDWRNFELFVSFGQDNNWTKSRVCHFCKIEEGGEEERELG